MIDITEMTEDEYYKLVRDQSRGYVEYFERRLNGLMFTVGALVVGQIFQIIVVIGLLNKWWPT